MEKIPWYMESTDAGKSPFKAVGDDWCQFCKEGVDAEQEAHSRGDEFVYRKRCKRCGGTIAWGAYRIQMLSGQIPSGDAYVFVREHGRDRS